MALAGWCAAMAWLLWCGQPQWAWLAVLGVVPGAVLFHQMGVLGLLAGASAWLSLTT